MKNRKNLTTQQQLGKAVATITQVLCAIGDQILLEHLVEHLQVQMYNVDRDIQNLDVDAKQEIKHLKKIKQEQKLLSKLFGKALKQRTKIKKSLDAIGWRE